jgi:alcohol dehydrogenase (cytochrome c)
MCDRKIFWLSLQRRTGFRITAIIPEGATARLSQINPGNIAGLQAEWVFHASNTKRLEVTPLVVNGMMLLTAANDAIALDARTGRVVWRHPWPISEGLIDDASGHTNRGVGVWHDRVYMETDNAHLLCLDARLG